ncbi:hypothetical protein SAMN02745673_01973 [Marinactinospora thermotolerans DSM 45154]|uniref:Uncharacterized protein n=1 Tax=Marinactinospora thermotolerans DSM 45154 TaxID=1122192 RepID=A0A1T4PSE6_9ACTN|nr:hypothetical protein [Marinactinospora thermotolerans]SJZ94475.1 hypothetical protein SAMN02745673_01973 [Marinactinospora thermotolerans DSM 45154]
MDLPLVEAWELWWSGRQLTDHSLHGVSVIWLGRIGKLLSFVAGCTIILDLIGPERLVAWGDRMRDQDEDNSAVLGMTISSAGFALLTAALMRPISQSLEGLPLGVRVAVWVGFLLVLIVLASGFVLFIGPVIAGLGRLLSTRQAEQVMRAVAVPLFFLGFALDYLAS